MPLRCRITNRHCRQPILPKFLYKSNRLFGGGAADDVTVAPFSISVCRRYHLPFIITISSELYAIDGPRQTYINFKKADLAWYAEACDEYIAEAGETRTVEQAMKILRKAVNKVTGLFIPAGRILHTQPTQPASVKSLADERDRKHRLILADKTFNDLDRKNQNRRRKTSDLNGNPPSTNATIEQAYRIYGGLLRA